MQLEFENYIQTAKQSYNELLKAFQNVLLQISKLLAY